MDKRIHVTILSPRSIIRRYLVGECRGTRMAKWALEAVNNGKEIACVHCKGLNYEKYGFEDAQTVLKNYLNRNKGYATWDLFCIDMSNPDAFYFTFKRRERYVGF